MRLWRPRGVACSFRSCGADEPRLYAGQCRYSVSHVCIEEDIIRYHDEVIAYLIYKGDGDYRPLVRRIPAAGNGDERGGVVHNAIRPYRSKRRVGTECLYPGRSRLPLYPTYKVLSPCSEAEIQFRIFTDIPFGESEHHADG